MNVLNLEECELLTDSKYRAYVSQVERALKAFEYTSEWADLISALGKLNKVLGNNIKYPVIPRRVTIGKRLAQCLHPALPSGVHLKVLETYDIIFKCIGTQRLASDLFTYGAGLFPLLGYAAMNVRPALLSLYEAHFVALRQHVKPALTGLIMGLLPGLEDGSEYFVKTTHLLEDFCEGVEPQFFYGCLWECVLASSTNRLAALNYVLAHFNRKQSLEDQLYFVGTSINLMVDALSSSLQDPNVLVQRSALDLLLCAFPMHCCHLSRADTVTLLTAAINVVLRRDMSLNRRLYAWLIGTDANGVPVAHVSHQTAGVDKVGIERQDSAMSETDLSYFETHSKAFLVQAVKNSLRDDIDSARDFDCRPAAMSFNLRPFKILMSLLDKPEIGSAILEDIFLDMLRCMYRECVTKADQVLKGKAGHLAGQKLEERNAAVSEVVKTANLLLGQLEPSFIWQYISRLLETTCASAKLNRQGSTPESISVTELCSVIEFLLDKLSVESYKETQTMHLPCLLKTLTDALTAHIALLSDPELLSSLRLVAKILLHVQPSATPLAMPVSPAVNVMSGTNNTSPVTVDDENQEMVLQAAAAAGGDEGLARSVDVGKIAGSCIGDVDGSSTNKMAEDLPLKNAPSHQQLDIASESSSSTLQVDDKQMESDSFCDFIRFEGGAAQDADGATPAARKLDMGAAQSQSGNTLLKSCILSYLKLFETIVSCRIVTCRGLTASFMERFLRSVPKDCVALRAENGPENDVECCLTGTGAPDLFHIEKVELDGLTKSLVDAFCSACQLLVDFSALPMYSVNADRSQLVIPGVAESGGTSLFASWLQQLLLCACSISHFDIETTSISTLFDLIVLAQSTLVQRCLSDASLPSTGTTPVLICPLLTLSELATLGNRTCFYKLVGTTLWNYLDERWPECHSRAGNLLYQLHQLSPDLWTCEDIICSALLSPDKAMKLAAHSRFAILWHLLRDKTTVCVSPTRGDQAGLFDRSLTVMLDSLHGNSNADGHLCAAMTQSWLLQSIERGDLIRILEPLLIILLHPDTARVSIQHVSVHKPCRIRTRTSECSTSTISESVSIDSIDAAEAKIFAISSEGGNVIYHVSAISKPISKRSVEELQTYAALTSVSDQGVTQTTRALNNEVMAAVTELNFDRVDAADVTLRVNPFGSCNSLDDDLMASRGSNAAAHPSLQNARRLSLETCRREGIFFDENHNNDEHTELADDECGVEVGEELKEIPADELVGQIIGDVIDAVIASKYSDEVPQGSSVDLGISGSSDVVSQAEGSPTIPVENSVGSISPSADNQYQEQTFNVPSSGSFSTERRMSQQSQNSFQPDIDNSGLWKMMSDTVDGRSDSSNPTVPASTVDTLPTVHPLHSHILLYTRKFDTRRAIYAFGRLAAILSTSPRLVVRALTTSNVGGAGTPRAHVLQSLLVRHRRSVLGRRFHGDDVDTSGSGVRSSMFVEVLVVICLYYIRAYYPNLLAASLNADDVADNSRLQVTAADILTTILGELAIVARSGGRGFATYIIDLLEKCKVQRTILHALVSSVHNARRRANVASDAVDISDSIVSFNDVPGSIASATFQTHLLHLLLSVIYLEHQLNVSRSESTQATALPPGWDKFDVNAPLTSPVARFLSGRPIVQQPMFLLVVTCALRQQHMCSMHRHWIACIVSALPYLGRGLARFMSATVAQICRNLELLSPLYEFGHVYRSLTYQPSKMPPDQVIMLLDGLNTICQYCLCDNNSQQELGVMGQSPGLAVGGMNTDGGIFTSLASVFHIGGQREVTPSKDEANQFSPRMDARSHLLKMLHHILSSLTILWKAAHLSESREGREGRGEHRQSSRSWWTLGAPKMIRKYTLELISPLALNHGPHLLAAVATVWNERRQRTLPSSIKSVIPTASEDQLVLVDMISAVKLLSIDSLMQTVRQIIKQPPLQSAASINNKKRIPLEVGLLRFFFIFIQRVEEALLAECWPLLLSLLKEGLQMNLTAPALFLLLIILNEFLQKTPMFEERKDQKDLQEVTQKLLEACAEVAGSSLEQTNFFRRNLAVKPGPQLDVTSEVDEATTDVDTEVSQSSPPEPARRIDAVAELRQYSVQALMLLAEVTVTLLDVVYRSEEKERVVPLLSSILYNVFPYLRNHSVHNLPSYRACSQMLSSLSSYQYTRRAWKREAFELMMEPTFFQTDEKCIEAWRSVIDNLMTHDKTTFKDLLVRVNITQGTSLNLFSSREAEYEQRAQLLKRLSFTIFCSEIDQYHRHMPDIQEKLADCLRLPAALPLQVQVFLCFRVLILRISSQHLTSLWPTIITELVRIMLLIEQDLTPDTEIDVNGIQMPKLANVDPSWAVGGTGSLASGGLNQAWLQLYLAACKLLDLALILPGDFLPHFQLYRWAFVGDSGNIASETDRRRLREQMPTFVPHVVRIARRMSARFGEIPLLPRFLQRPLLTPGRAASLDDLCGFFASVHSSLKDGSTVTCSMPSAAGMSRLSTGPASHTLPRARSAPNVSCGDVSSSVTWTTSELKDDTALSPMEYIEKLVLRDFLEPMPPN